MKDLYSLLHVPTNANDSEIKKSYRKLAFQCHPDKNNSSEAAAQFREISEAYDILSDEKKRCVAKGAVDWTYSTFACLAPFSFYDFACPFNVKASFFACNPRMFELT